MNGERRGERWVWLAMLVAMLAWSARGAGVDLRALLGESGRHEVWRFLAGLFPPDLSPSYLAGIVEPAIETVQMSLLGVVFGALIAVPLSVMAARTLSAPEHPGERGLRSALGSWVYSGARSALNVMRTIPDLVWALMFIAAVGLGPFAGVLALTVHGAGLLGKLYAETMESVDPAPVDTLRATGASGLATFIWGVLPQSAPQLTSITLYQWECNIRAAMVLGFVGAGGLGQRIDLAMRLFRYEEMLTLIATLLVMVAVVDRLSALVRKRLTRFA